MDAGSSPPLVCLLQTHYGNKPIMGEAQRQCILYMHVVNSDKTVYYSVWKHECRRLHSRTIMMRDSIMMGDTVMMGAYLFHFFRS